MQGDVQDGSGKFTMASSSASNAVCILFGYAMGGGEKNLALKLLFFDNFFTDIHSTVGHALGRELPSGLPSWMVVDWFAKLTFDRKPGLTTMLP